MIVNNLAIEYEDQGSGPTMLLLHGWQDSLHTFDRITHLLSSNFRIVSLDLPGFGQSEAPHTPWELNDYVKFSHDFIKKLNLQPEFLLGHSFGGRIIIKGLSEKIFNPKKIILIASAGLGETSSYRARLFYILAKLGKIITFIPPFIFFRKKLRKKLYQSAGSDYLNSGNLRETYLNIIRENLASAAAQITLPTLLIWGELDRSTPLTDAKKFVSIMGNSSLSVLPKATHFVHQEEAETVVALIKKFCT